jgi:hypothetical protein
MRTTTATFQERTQSSEDFRTQRTCRRKLKGPSSDALCNGVYVTPLHRASEYGRLGSYFEFPVHTVLYKIVNSEARPYMVILGSCFLCPLLERCIIDTVAFQSKNGQLEVGNVDIMSYGIPECFIMKTLQFTLCSNGEMVFKYFLRDCFYCKLQSDLFKVK